MSLPVSAPDYLYQQLLDLPERLVGEIMDGCLYAHPRPAALHTLAASALGADVHGAFHRGRGGPGGWWILDEPEVHFVRDTEVVVPDIGGWTRRRLPRLPADQRFEVVPDWVCEIASPSTAKVDRAIKMPLYARYGVAFLWLVDPLARTLEAYALQDGRWSVIGQFKDADEAAVAPFTALTLALADLWVESED
jgi:Uma2 family endonuclease